jgi:hypothetical protein
MVAFIVSEESSRSFCNDTRSSIGDGTVDNGVGTGGTGAGAGAGAGAEAGARAGVGAGVLADGTIVGILGATESKVGWGCCTELTN